MAGLQPGRACYRGAGRATGHALLRTRGLPGGLGWAGPHRTVTRAECSPGNGWDGAQGPPHARQSVSHIEPLPALGPQRPPAGWHTWRPAQRPGNAAVPLCAPSIVGRHRGAAQCSVRCRWLSRAHPDPPRLRCPCQDRIVSTPSAPGGGAHPHTAPPDDLTSPPGWGGGTAPRPRPRPRWRACWTSRTVHPETTPRRRRRPRLSPPRPRRPPQTTAPGCRDQVSVARVARCRRSPCTARALTRSPLSSLPGGLGGRKSISVDAVPGAAPGGAAAVGGGGTASRRNACCGALHARAHARAPPL